MLTKVAELAQKLDNNVENVKSELKRVQSIKCRLAKQKTKSTYEVEMSQVLNYEQTLKEVRTYLAPPKVTFTTMTEKDIEMLTYEETIRAIKSVQSKKCNTQYMTENLEDNVEYQDAIRIEKLLLAHKVTVKPVEDNVINKSSLNELIHNLESVNDMSKEDILNKLKQLLS